MNSRYGYSQTIKKAASRVRGERLLPLMELCENQKKVSTRRLTRLVVDLLESDREDGIHFRELAKLIKQQHEGSDNGFA